MPADIIIPTPVATQYENVALTNPTITGGTASGMTVAGPINAQTGTTYVLAATDVFSACALVTLSNANPITVTVPKNSAVPIAVGSTINLQQIGAGQVTFAPVDGDVTINPSATLKISAQWKGATLIKTATNVWSLIGSLSA